MVSIRYSTSTSQNRECAGRFSVPVLLLLNLLCFQLGRTFDSIDPSLPVSLIASAQGDTNPLLPRQDQAVSLPSLRVAETQSRKIYGGKGDKAHLGGWTNIDINGLSPFVWRMMMREYGIKSIIDVGCGRGISTTWFIYNGMDTLCVEGSHDAFENSMLPDKSIQMVEHDFSRGPWWPAKTYDAVWCVEFLEHVGRNYHQNYLPVFRKAAIIFATHSIWGGWHHVEVHSDEWWIRKYELYGFKYMPDVTQQVRDMARKEAFTGPKTVTGSNPNPQNLYNMLVFFNPAVGALPEHAHLFAEPGCFVSRGNNTITQRDCGTMSEGNVETSLPPEYKPLPVLEKNHQLWEERVKRFIKPQEKDI